jgi:hypothetical protein
MGAFYGSVHVRTEDRDAVQKVLEQVAKKLKARFLLGPALNGWVAVYPDTNGQDVRVAGAIAAKLPLDVLYVMVHDDDIFMYSFYQGGQLVDQYNSCPDYFDGALDAEDLEEEFGEEGPDCGGRPEVFRHLLRSDRALAELEALVSPERTGSVLFASDLLVRFAGLLGLANVATAYEYLMQDEAQDVEGWDDFLHVPDLSAEKAKQRAAEDQLAAARQRLRDEGLLFLEQSGTGKGPHVTMPVWCPDRDGGFYVCWNNPYQQVAPPLERYGPPWDAGPQPTGLTSGGYVMALASSPSGRYLVTGTGTGQAKLWDAEHARPVLDVKQVQHIVWVGFTPDEKYLITLSAGEGVVTALDTRQRVAFAVLHGKTAAVHPSGTLVVADELGKLLFVDLPSGKVRKTLCVGGKQDLGGIAGLLAAQLQQGGRPVDVAAVRERLEAGLRKQLENTEALQEKVRAAYRKAGVPEPKDLAERMRQEMEKLLADMAKQMERLQAAARPGAAVPQAERPTQGTERLHALEISADGRWLSYAAQPGVRVLAWDAVAAAAENTPDPAFAVAAEPVNVQVGQSGVTTTQAQTFTLAHDAAANRVLFAGLEGKVKSLDLATGQVGVLLDPPGRPAIHRLGLARDRSALCCTCSPELFAGNNRKPPLVQVWNYAALSARLGERPNLRLFGEEA